MSLGKYRTHYIHDHNFLNYLCTILHQYKNWVTEREEVELEGEQHSTGLLTSKNEVRYISFRPELTFCVYDELTRTMPLLLSERQKS